MKNLEAPRAATPDIVVFGDRYARVGRAIPDADVAGRIILRDLPQVYAPLVSAELPKGRRRHDVAHPAFDLHSVAAAYGLDHRIFGKCWAAGGRVVHIRQVR